MKYIFLLLLSSILLSKEKFQLEYAMHFKTIRNYNISDDGNWFYFTTKPDLGNTDLTIVNLETNNSVTFGRVSSIKTSKNFETFLFKTIPDIVDKSNDKKKKLKDSLVIYNPSTRASEIIPHVSSFDVSNNGAWAEYERTIEDSKQIFLKHVDSKTEIYINDLKESMIDSLSSNYFYIKESEDNLVNGIYYRDLNVAFAPEILIEKDSLSVFDGLSWNKNKGVLAYKKAKLDSNDKPMDYEIQIWTKSSNLVKTAVKDSVLESWFIPEINTLRWTEDGERLWFGFKPFSEKYDDDDDDKDKTTQEDFYDFDKILDKTQMYLWHWKDEKIITEEQTNWNRSKDDYYYSVYHLEEDKLTNMASEDLPDISFTDNPNYAIAYDPTPYKKITTWDYWYFDLYLIDLNSGDKIKIDEKLTWRASISPNGKKLAYFKGDDWYLFDLKSKKSQNLTANLSEVFYDELNDRPRPNGAYGYARWYDDNNSFLISDRYDLWKVNTIDLSINKITSGREERTSFSLYRFRGDDRFLKNDEKLFFEAFNDINKEQYLFAVVGDSIVNRHVENLKTDLRIKAKNSDNILITKQSYSQFPDVYLTNSNLQDHKNLTNLHPEIIDYNWGKTEMVDYVTEAGDTLQGYVIKPDDFDPDNEYPLFVYFYERFSDRRHEFVIPMINHRPVYPYYVGKGYCMFFPDIKFYEGNPGPSGMDAVISGCKKLISEGYIDSSKIAIHGHSWSGYQSAYFVTQTDFFAACVTGAPVSNMTSAYSGIRLGSGLARQFQYESTQSRIGGNLIDSLDSYIRNSPVFFADKMNTPMLIMFGDVDDAVPWQQGVELFLACRRFDKPAIMLQYEKEPHHLRKYHNKLDYAIRMSEFFDHFVLGKPAKDWIIEGIKYKGKYNTGNN